MSSSPSSSSDENYFSAAEYISPYKQGAAAETTRCSLSASLHALNDASHEAMVYVNQCASVDPRNEETLSSENPWSNMELVAKNLETARSKLDQAWRDAKMAHDTETGKPSDDDDTEDESEDESTIETVGLSDGDVTVPVNLDLQLSMDAGGVSNVEDRETASNGKNHEKEEANIDMMRDDFRAQYMEMMTETFGNDLEEIHQQGGENVDVQILVECLQSGMNFLESHEQNQTSFFESIGFDGNGDETMKDSLGKNSEQTIHQLRQYRLGYIQSKENGN